jgi:hypothetical protein
VGKGTYDRCVRIGGRSVKWYETAILNKVVVNIVTPLLKDEEAEEQERNTISKYQSTCINQQFANHTNQKIVCLNRNGDLVKIYNRAIDATLDGFKSGCIINCCKGKRGLHHNYIWMYKSEYDKDGFSYKKAFNHSKWIEQVDLKGRIIRRLLTAQSFVQFGFNAKNIQQVCSDSKKSHQGYKFRYTD